MRPSDGLLSKTEVCGGREVCVYCADRVLGLQVGDSSSLRRESSVGGAWLKESRASIREVGETQVYNQPFSGLPLPLCRTFEHFNKCKQRETHEHISNRLMIIPTLRGLFPGTPAWSSHTPESGLEDGSTLVGDTVTNDFEVGCTELSADMWMRSASPRWQSLEAGLIGAVTKALPGLAETILSETSEVSSESSERHRACKTARGGPFQNFKFRHGCIT